MMESYQLVKDERIRGSANSELTPEVAAELGAALGTLLGEGVLVVTARDYYPPSRMLKRSFSAGLMSTGVTVVDFHAATFPELAFAVKKFGARAGVHFTVSSYRSHEIAIKLLDYLGIEFSHERLSNLMRLFETKHIVRTLPERIGWVTYAEYIHEIYVASLASFLDSTLISDRRLNIVADLNFGPTADVAPYIFSELGVDATTLNAHKPQAKKGIRHLPSPIALMRLARMVRAASAEFGVAFCVDASRAVFVDDKGRIMPPDKTIALFASFLPSGSTVVTTMTASSIVDKVAENKRLRVVRVRGYPGDVSRQARRVKAPYGGSDKGEHIFTGFSMSPDGLVALGRMMEILAGQDRRLSTLVDELPEVPVHEETVDVPGYLSMQRALDLIAEHMAPSRLTVTGLKVIVDKYVVYLEPSLKKRVLVLSVEEPSREKIEAVRKLRDSISELFSTSVMSS